MLREELLQMHDELCQKAKAIMVQKNKDYSGGEADPFANFKGSLQFGVQPEIGIMMRMQDKMMRVRAFLVNGDLSVVDETAEDSIVDNINYLILMVGMLRDRRQAAEHKQVNDEKTMQVVQVINPLTGLQVFDKEGMPVLRNISRPNDEAFQLYEHSLNIEKVEVPTQEEAAAEHLPSTITQAELAAPIAPANFKPIVSTADMPDME